ncbi:GntR family transcriptional regulator [Psychrobacter aestuarii]|uniref:GntR family transcriptional regulator n=1 Tax=Psychrobacter aestuarii TaxID=556327 RepID=A0ABN0VL26_9GAMM|nr:GntR family transcriptional regulator [Psychrobacter aestuarii]
MDNFDKFKMPRYEQVRWYIQSLLVDNKWDTDTALPTEQELAATCEVSVGTVRKAVEKLVEDGVLVKQQGRGTFLKQPNFENSLSRFFKFRDKEVSYVTPTGIIKSVASIDAIESVNQKLQLKKNQPLLYIERVRMVDDKVILSERIWLPRHLFRAFINMAPSDFGNLLYPFYYQQCGQFVSSATETLFFVKNHVDEYLNNAATDNLVKVCRVARNLKGEPIEYRESYGLADSFSYEIDIS